jgi:hypothetical protein
VRRLLPCLIAACAATGRVEAIREADGTWVAAFAADVEATYHAAMAALVTDGWKVMRADPIGASLTARSETAGLAHVAIEPDGAGGSRVRLGLDGSADAAALLAGIRREIDK